MSHEIDQSNARDNIAYVGQTPWHGLGTVLQPGTDLDAWIVAAGLSHRVLQAPVHMELPRAGSEISDMKAVPELVANYREDTGAFLGVVSKRGWKMVQPRDVIDFYRQFAANSGLKLEVAGSLKGGKRVWALARLDDPIRVGAGNQDLSFPYFLLTTGFDGEIGTIGTFTATRVVCWNTISMVYQEVADQEAKKGKLVTGFNVPHCAEFKPEVAKQQVEYLIEAAKQYGSLANLMADVGSSSETALTYFTALFGKKRKDSEDLTGQSRAAIDELLDLYENGPGASFKSARGTVWGLLNAVSRYVDHAKAERSEGGRLNNAWFGEGKSTKLRAMNFAKSLVSAVGPTEAKQVLSEKMSDLNLYDQVS